MCLSCPHYTSTLEKKAMEKVNRCAPSSRSRLNQCDRRIDFKAFLKITGQFNHCCRFFLRVLEVLYSIIENEFGEVVCHHPHVTVILEVFVIHEVNKSLFYWNFSKFCMPFSSFSSHFSEGTVMAKSIFPLLPFSWGFVKKLGERLL